MGVRTRSTSGPGPLMAWAGLAAAACAALSCLLPSRATAPGAPDAGTLPPADAPRAVAAEAAAHSPPVTLTVPGHLRATPVDPVTATRDGSLAVPESPSRLGWWALGAPPGAPRGTLLLAGHLDSATEGAGPFEALHDVPIGARVHVTAADGVRHTYTVVARRTYAKRDLPRDLFTSQGSPRLALVTCAGDFDPDERVYAGNLVLYGVPVQPPYAAGTAP
ncbi:class F sortase [Streptomyces sp. NPDC050856]|uniref:class F sortase n=1 Tax=Streptomyces sp. NPDC050856 TaxID=3154939 RepID=UPI0033F73CED